MFSYSRSKGERYSSLREPFAHLDPCDVDFAADHTPSGLFAGLALDGTILVERKDANREFYGSNISATDILT